jgi:hypothetical protein
MPMHEVKEWQFLRGAFVEVRVNGQPIRSGVVDDVIEDGSAVWINGHWPETRKYVEKSAGIAIWTDECVPSSKDNEARVWHRG